jgi:hypothetical protein
MVAVVRFCLGVGVAAIVVAVPYLDYRANYAHHKRLREVTPGVLYRSGQLTAAGLSDAIARVGARAVVNCMNEFPDPELMTTYWDRRIVREADVCRRAGVRLVHLDPDLSPDRTDPRARPRVIDEFLAVLDDPANRPALLHCKAGLHRTGVLVAVYRMEYEGWDAPAAVAELKAHGFGDRACTAANDYIRQYVLNYTPRRAGSRVQGLGSGVTSPRP